MAQLDLEQLLERINNKALPPVHTWDPPLSGEMDMKIAVDGNWYYQGSLINRKRMVKLFSTILRFEQDHHYLVTPVEKFQINVEDAPFVVTQVDRIDADQPLLVFTTNVDDEVIANKNHQLIVNTDQKTRQPRPYLHIRDGLNALISRNVFYQLVEWSESIETDGQQELVVYSQGETFLLGCV